MSRKQAKLAAARAEVAEAMSKVLEETLKTVDLGLPLPQLMAGAAAWAAARSTIVEAFRATLSRKRSSALADSKGEGRDRDVTEDALAECRMDAPVAIEFAFDMAAREGLLVFLPDTDQRVFYKTAVLNAFIAALPAVIREAGRWHQKHRRKVEDPAANHKHAQAMRRKQLGVKRCSGVPDLISRA